MSPISEASYVISGAQDERKMQSPPLKKNASEYEDICKGPSECQARSHIESQPCLLVTAARTIHVPKTCQQADSARLGLSGAAEWTLLMGTLSFCPAGSCLGHPGSQISSSAQAPRGWW